MRSVATTVLLAAVVGLAALSAAMFGFVLLAAPGECTEPTCAAVQTYDPTATEVASPALEPSPAETGGPPPAVAPEASPPGDDPDEGDESPAASPEP